MSLVVLVDKRRNPYMSMYSCTCICTHVCTYVRIYASKGVCVSAYVLYICAYEWTYVTTSVHVRPGIQGCSCVRVL